MAPSPADLRIERGGTSFVVRDHSSSREGRAAFLGMDEAATLAFFDAALPDCRRLIDLGAFVGFMSLYAAAKGVDVVAIEASPAHQVLFLDNLARNPGLMQRVTLHPVAAGACDGTVRLFRKGTVDSGTSVYETVERAGLMRGHADAAVPQRAADDLLRELRLDRETLLKIDVEGAEYAILPTIAESLASIQPFLLVSFHPFNLVAADPYRTALARLKAAISVAQALASYKFIYQPHASGGTPVRWHRVEQDQREHFLADHLLTPKVLPRIATPQYGFVGAVAFSPVRIPALEGSP